MTRQQIFNKSCAGLASQDFLVSFTSGGFCVYRGSRKRRCAIGHLIDDKTARKWDKVGNITRIASQHPEEFKSIFGGVSIRFLCRLQDCHDLAAYAGCSSEQSESMKHNLVMFAKRHKLKVPAYLTKPKKK